jgi:hypothetical protein
MTVVQEMLAGGVGCAVANGSLNSFETTKVKLQLHQPAKPVYMGIRGKLRPCMAGVISQVIREDGLVRGLMLPGLSASLARSMTYGSYRVGFYPTVRSMVCEGGEPTLLNMMVAGSITGAIGSAISCPLDCVRTRMQVWAQPLLLLLLQLAVEWVMGRRGRAGSVWSSDPWRCLRLMPGWCATACT